MTHRFTTSCSAAAAVAILAVAFGAPTVAGQTKSSSSTAKTWTLPLTVDGQPDLQGSWDYANITPFERPAEFATKPTFTNEEAAEFERAALASINKDRRDDEESGGGDRIVNGTKETDDLARAYNEFWWDRGTKISKTNRTSLVVDPPDGKVPPLTADATKKMADRALVESRPAWSHEDRPAGERCLHQQRTGPPINPGGYNNHLRIFQTSGQVAILTEQIHDTRIIPLDGRPHVNIHGWKGDSRGHWEGNTLVVDTVNFKDSVVASYRGSGPNMHLTEKFSRLDADTLLYEYTVDDPASFTKPWTVQMTMSKFTEPIYEYACHEGNYGIVGSLSGARAVDKRTTEGGTK